MYTIANVIEQQKDGTVVLGCKSSACQGCKAEMFCNNKEMNTYSALNPYYFDLKNGDTVQVYLPPGKTILATIMIFAFPLILFPVFFILCRYLFNESEIKCAISGLIGMGVAFAVSAFINVHNKKSLMPIIKEKI